ncbi:MAG: hypothetical protein GY784_10425 [Gammaproteobacteria bacterium]|nr:hypothetical protein [Gammaproteobacteria bacterium]
MRYIFKLLIACLLLMDTAAQADEVHIVDVTVHCQTDCSFAVTLQHADTGWDHYANQWDVVTPDGKILKSRVLYHPHVNEQPFTRSLSGVSIPTGLKQVKIRARDLKHGYSSQEYLVDIPD